jgi:hypothetical protein
MNSYSIVRVGNAYIVQAQDKSILTIATRRMAIRLVAEASQLLDSSAAPDIVPTDRHAGINRP